MLGVTDETESDIDMQRVCDRLNELTALANGRRMSADGIFAATVGGADVDFMTPDELQERHELLMLLPTSAEEREAAIDRIRERIAERNRGRR